MEEGDCPICLDGLTQDLRALPCGHVFHALCIQEAVRVKRQCPQCRRPTASKEIIRLYFKVTTSDTNSASGSGSPSRQMQADAADLAAKYELKMKLLRNQIAALREEGEAADRKFQKWEEYSTKMQNAFRQLEAQVATLKKDKQKAEMELHKAKRRAEELERQATANAVDDATMEFLKSNDMQALEKELQQPAQIIVALKKANKFRLEQYQKLLQKLQAKTRESEKNEMVKVKEKVRAEEEEIASGNSSPRKRLKRSRPLKMLPAFNMNVQPKIVEIFDDVVAAPAPPQQQHGQQRLQLPTQPRTTSFNRPNLKPFADHVVPKAPQKSVPGPAKNMSIRAWLQ